MKIHRSIPAIDECENEDSLGMICVRCNRCGRWEDGEIPPHYEELPNDEETQLKQYLSKKEG